MASAAECSASVGADASAVTQSSGGDARDDGNDEKMPPLSAAPKKAKGGVGRCGMLHCTWSKSSNNWAAAWYPHVETQHPELLAGINPSTLHTNPRTGLRWWTAPLLGIFRYVCEFCKRTYSTLQYIEQHTCTGRRGLPFLGFSSRHEDDHWPTATSPIAAAPSIVSTAAGGVTARYHDCSATTLSSVSRMATLQPGAGSAGCCKEGVGTCSAAAYVLASTRRAQCPSPGDVDTDVDSRLRAGAQTLGALEQMPSEDDIAAISKTSSTWLGELLAHCRAHGVRTKASSVQCVYAVAIRLLQRLLSSPSVFTAFTTSTNEWRISRAYLLEQNETLRQLAVRDRDPLAPRMLMDCVTLHLLGLCTRGLHVRHPYRAPQLDASTAVTGDDILCVPCSVTELCTCGVSRGSLVGLPHIFSPSADAQAGVLAFLLPSNTIPSWFRDGTIDESEVERRLICNMAAVTGMPASAVLAVLPPANESAVPVLGAQSVRHVCSSIPELPSPAGGLLESCVAASHPPTFLSLLPMHASATGVGNAEPLPPSATSTSCARLTPGGRLGSSDITGSSVGQGMGAPSDASFVASLSALTGPAELKRKARESDLPPADSTAKRYRFDISAT